MLIDCQGHLGAHMLILATGRMIVMIFVPSYRCETIIGLMMVGMTCWKDLIVVVVVVQVDGERRCWAGC